MGFFSDDENKSYHAPGKADYFELNKHPDEVIEKWATDPRCIEKEICAEFLVKRRELRATAKALRDEQQAAKRRDLADNPFDPRTEVSADARHIANRIVANLWILFVLLPIAASILYAILK
jgi:hypothetical protein